MGTPWTGQVDTQNYHGGQVTSCLQNQCSFLVTYLPAVKSLFFQRYIFFFCIKNSDANALCLIQLANI